MIRLDQLHDPVRTDKRNSVAVLSARASTAVSKRLTQTRDSGLTQMTVGPTGFEFHPHKKHKRLVVVYL